MKPKKRGRPRGSRNIVASQATALAFLLEKRDPQAVYWLGVIGSLAYGARYAFAELGKVAQWYADARVALRALDAPPPLTTKLTSFAFDYVVANGNLLEGTPMASASHSQTFLAGMTILDQTLKSRALLPTAHAFGELATKLGKLVSLEKAAEQVAFGLWPTVYAAGELRAPLRAQEQMAFAVVTGVEQPTADFQQRLNTWSKRAKVLEQMAKEYLAGPELNLLARTVRTFQGKVPENLEQLTGLAVRARARVATIQSEFSQDR